MKKRIFIAVCRNLTSGQNKTKQNQKLLKSHTFSFIIMTVRRSKIKNFQSECSKWPPNTSVHICKRFSNVLSTFISILIAIFRRIIFFISSFVFTGHLWTCFLTVSTKKIHFRQVWTSCRPSLGSPLPIHLLRCKYDSLSRTFPSNPSQTLNDHLV